MSYLSFRAGKQLLAGLADPWWPTRKDWACAFVLAIAPTLALAQSSSDETRRIATIDFYGLKTLDSERLRTALPVHEGDLVRMRDAADVKRRIQAGLSAVPHIRDVHATAVCCAQDGGIQMFIGVQEDTSRVLRFRPAPSGATRLPAELLTADAAATAAVTQAVLQGHTTEDDSLGHAFLTDAPEARALQEKLVPLAARNLDILRRVLHDSADAEQRAAAARLLGYAPDLQSVVGDLSYAVTDPYPAVRNDAVRALGVFTRGRNPPRIPYGPFIELLSSPEWTDLNKSSFALDALSEGRDPALLSLLRQRALPALVTMVRWHDPDHTFPAYSLLGKIGGLSDKEIQTHFERRDAGAVIAAALKRSPGPAEH